MSASRLSVALVQRASSIDPEANLASLEEVAALTAATDPPDLVVLPEAFARDFGEAGSDLSPYAEAPDGRFATRLREVAGDSVVVAGMFETAPDRDHPFNTLVAVGPGVDARYRKIHLYDSFGFRESDQLSAGPLQPCLIEVGGFRVGLLTCYDLRFPELSRALVDAGAEVLVLPAAWLAGERKVEHWRTLLRARAIENTVFMVGVDQPAPRYCGHSLVAAPNGDVLVEAGEGEEVLHAALERDLLEQVRRQNPSLANRRM